jgi:DNA polymerase III subunit epsilon
LSLLRRDSWRESCFIVVDVETTGLDPDRDEVVSFAGVPIESARIVARDSVHGLVRPSAPPSGASVEIHGLRGYDLTAAKPAPEALAPLAAGLPGRVPVVHAQWVERTFLRKAGCPLPRRIVDTAVLWRLLSIERGQGDPGVCSLSTIAAGLGLPAHRPHTAEGDALTAAQAFLAMAAHLEARRGHMTARALTGARSHVRAWRTWHGPERFSRG